MLDASLLRVELRREMAGGIVVARLVVLCFFLVACRRRAQVHSQRSTGCVPGRCSFMVFILCGSLQSHRAMVLLPALVSLLSSPFSSSGAPVEAGGQRRRQMKTMDASSTKDLWDLIAKF
ncbi:hypothetical protein U9M48_021604 [Paspalum notatum var. saurae]|uniref:Uncharacterized protein n=1 Tax=Paspalum notatum var. saurae TaxID=547442 RepID=A0AAQ3TKZ3_PASNO